MLFYAHQSDADTHAIAYDHADTDAHLDAHADACSEEPRNGDVPRQ
jgi:hypothetical protein